MSTLNAHMTQVASGEIMERGRRDETLPPAYDFSVLQVTSQGKLEVRDEFKCAPGLCLTMLAEKASALAQ
jgi:hypothetical protein